MSPSHVRRRLRSNRCCSSHHTQVGDFGNIIVEKYYIILLKSICTKSHNKWWTSTSTERAATINKLLKCKSRSGIPASQPLPPFFAPENCNYRFPAIWCPTLVSAHRHPVPNRLRFFFCPIPSTHWFVLTSCVPSRWMCHYTARSDGRCRAAGV